MTEDEKAIWYRKQYDENRTTIERMEKRIVELKAEIARLKEQLERVTEDRDRWADSATRLEAKLAARDEALIRPWREAVELWDSESDQDGLILMTEQARGFDSCAAEKVRDFVDRVRALLSSGGSGT